MENLQISSSILYNAPLTNTSYIFTYFSRIRQNRPINCTTNKRLPLCEALITQRKGYILEMSITVSPSSLPCEGHHEGQRGRQYEGHSQSSKTLLHEAAQRDVSFCQIIAIGG